MNQIYHEGTIYTSQTIISVTMSSASGLYFDTCFVSTLYGGGDLFDCLWANYGGRMDGVVQVVGVDAGRVVDILRKSSETRICENGIETVLEYWSWVWLRRKVGRSETKCDGDWKTEGKKECEEKSGMWHGDGNVHRNDFVKTLLKKKTLCYSAKQRAKSNR